MNDEINKILDRLERIDHKEYSGGFEFADSASFDETTRCFEERKKMANYITNLQQKIEQYENPDDLTLFYMWLDEKAKDKMKELQQENKKLKDELETMTFTAKIKQEAIDTLIKRIDKAIEYINLYAGSDNNYCLDYHDLNPLLDILKGDSNE